MQSYVCGGVGVGVGSVGLCVHALYVSGAFMHFISPMCVLGTDFANTQCLGSDQKN